MYIVVRLSNPLRVVVLYIGLALVRADLIEPERARRTTHLAWPRILTGIARMSKNAVDIAMVGVAVGSAGIAGVGFASPFWGLAFAAGGGIAAGTIALVSQRYGAKRLGAVDRAVRSSAVIVVAITLPLIAIFWVFGGDLVALLSNDTEAVALGATYLGSWRLASPLRRSTLSGVGCSSASTTPRHR